MDIAGNPLAAANAYSSTAKVAGGTDGAASPNGAAAGGMSFGDMLESATKSAIDTVRKGEEASAAGVAGKANLVDITLATNQAKLTLETVVAVRDSAIDAYNRIASMPI
jgi:flagellar hook-basal body complex protein FliE